MKKIIWSIALLGLLQNSACTRNTQNATVTVDTVETDFFDGLTPTAAEFTFEGILPCADCMGIKTNLVLNNDSLSYFLTETYMGKTNPDSVFLRSGTFTRLTATDSVSTILQLSAVKELPPLNYKVISDSILKKLDNQGQEILGNHNYLLTRK
ncbi:MAG: copper resistance protein NlpE N-terminal domain-containing protein [Bacteroidetes bacterium]|nr:copper resistance protein NlpE N-terminal domain-containing protein [Bacteroidota bacterium]